MQNPLRILFQNGFIPILQPPLLIHVHVQQTNKNTIFPFLSAPFRDTASTIRTLEKCILRGTGSLRIFHHFTYPFSLRKRFLHQFDGTELYPPDRWKQELAQGQWTSPMGPGSFFWKQWQPAAHGTDRWTVQLC